MKNGQTGQKIEEQYKFSCFGVHPKPGRFSRRQTGESP
jgi:hypothetical protein